MFQYCSDTFTFPQGDLRDKISLNYLSNLSTSGWTSCNLFIKTGPVLALSQCGVHVEMDWGNFADNELCKLSMANSLECPHSDIPLSLNSYTCIQRGSSICIQIHRHFVFKLLLARCLEISEKTLAMKFFHIFFAMVVLLFQVFTGKRAAQTGELRGADQLFNGRRFGQIESTFLFNAMSVLQCIKILWS